MKSKASKIFGIGLSKTGTSSLAKALEILGYRTRDYLGLTTYTPGDLSSIDLAEIERNEAFTDTPIPSFYKELDQQYPGSLFILTVRERESWLKSCKKQFTKRATSNVSDGERKALMALYGCIGFDRERFIDGYERFVNDVEKYFCRRRKDLLIIDICGGDAWEPLCKFLNRPMPKVVFPKSNVTAIQWIKIEDLVAIARRAGRKLSESSQATSRTSSTMIGIKPIRTLINNGAKELKRISLSVLGVMSGRQRIRHDMDTIIYQEICDGLNQLNPSIPILGEHNRDLPYSGREKWNHFWLVAANDGRNGVTEHTDVSSVNIALIEGGKPIFGVVYIPQDDTTYFAKGDLGSFKMEGDGRPTKLGGRRDERALDRELQCTFPSGVSSKMGGDDRSGRREVEEREGEVAGVAVQLCKVADEMMSSYSTSLCTMEWDTAAAHAVLRFAGKNIYTLEQKEELTYNKKDLSNEGITVE
jgi:3'-phosphoadenosine 5'-phosphosulfate (PAPS) 3'-phosphatase